MDYGDDFFELPDFIGEKSDNLIGVLVLSVAITAVCLALYFYPIS